MGAASSAFQLPMIATNSKNSPFRGFLDISLVSQKLRKTMASEKRGKSVSTITNQAQDVDDEKPKEALKGKKRSTSRKESKGVMSMSPKVLETWINDTLKDAEHLDIPGVVLKP